MSGSLATDLSKKCRQFVMAHWGKDGLMHIKERPVSWVRHEANPQLKLLRRRHKNVPLIAVHGEVNRVYLHLSTEKLKKGHV